MRDEPFFVLEIVVINKKNWILVGDQMGTESFFDKQTEESKLKSEIVSKYFSGWANVMSSLNNHMIMYLDLYSGPGRYKDGKPSTPLLVLEKAINHWNPKVCKKIKFIFNDSDPECYRKLEYEIRNFPGYDKLRLTPSLQNLEVGEQTLKDFEMGVKVPTLSFIDPWGYKGLSLPLIRALVKDWGCDSIFFFNYRRINPGIENWVLENPITLVFTQKIYEELREEISGRKPHEREKIILGRVKAFFQECDMNYVLPFPFKNEGGKRTTHYLIFVSKDIKGHNIMLETMGALSSYNCQGVPSFEFNPVPRLMFGKPLDDLKQTLLNDFAGMSLRMEDIFKQHQIHCRPYLKKNYKTALLELEKEGLLKTNRVEKKRQTGYFPDDLIAFFPTKGNK